MSVFSQFTGGAFVTQYGTIFVRSLGTFDLFSWTVFFKVAVMIGSMVAFARIDTYGRRPIYIACASIAAALMFAIGGLGIGHITTLENAAKEPTRRTYAIHEVRMFSSANRKTIRVFAIRVGVWICW